MDQRAARPQSADILELEASPQTRHGVVNTAFGGETHYWVYSAPHPASPAAPRVLLLSGLGCSHYSWERTVLFLVLARGWSVMALDNRGCGLSRSAFAAESPHCSVDMLARDAAAALGDAGWWPRDEGEELPAQSVHVVGHSMGGMIAQELALLRPASVCSLTLVSTHAGGSTWSTMPSVRVLRNMLGCVGSPPSCDRVLRLVARNNYSDDYLRQHGDRAMQRLRRQMDLNGGKPAASPSTIREHVGAIMRHDTRERLRFLRGSVRSQVIVGSRDSMIPPANARLLARELSCDLHVAEGAAHDVVEDGPGPEWFFAKLTGFIGSSESAWRLASSC
eukprot:m51a1_g9063 hypothetical protein (335) ;mRNA; r:83780-84784